MKAFGHIDVMINNAGLMPHLLLDGLKVEEWERMIDVNIKGVLCGDRVANSITEPDVSAAMHTFYEQYAIPADSFARAVIFALSQP